MNIIQDYENTLRSLIIQILSNEFGCEYEKYFGVTAGRLQAWKDKQEEYKRKMRGVETETRLIYFSDFYDLKKIITSNWVLFKGIFKEKKRFEVFFLEIEKYRNEVAHGRTLLLFQEYLISGILGDLKTQLILYRCKNMNEDDFFLKIMKVNDNIGNVFDLNSLGSYANMNHKYIRPGDILEFHVEAYDPKGRDIIFILKYGSEILQDRTLKNSFKVEIKPEHVSRLFNLRLIALTDEDEFDNDQEVSFHYTVLPVD
jgi:hypothetical protein